MIEPIFGQVKHDRRIDRFTRRGLPACRAEWRLVMATQPLQAPRKHHRGRLTKTEQQTASSRSAADPITPADATP